MKVAVGVLFLLVVGISPSSYLLKDARGQGLREMVIGQVDDKGKASREAEMRHLTERMEQSYIAEQRRVKPIEDRFSEGVRRSSAIVLYEGLPHQMFEKRLLEEERGTKAVQEVQGFPFYREKLKLKDMDATRLSEVLSNTEKLGRVPVPGMVKRCGGFHPDYAVEWSQGEKRFQALICFGCGDVRLFGSGDYAERDLHEEVNAELKKLLLVYRKNRPPKG